MTRSQCDTLSADVLRIMLDMEDEILRMIAAQIGRDGNVSDTSKWRIRQLARSGRMKAQTAAVISSYLPAQEQAVYDAVIAAATEEIGYLDKAVQAANAEGLANYFSDVPAEDSAVFAAKAFGEQAASDLNLVNTVMQYKAGSTYVDAINGIYFDASKRQERLDDMGVGAAMLSSGHVSLQEATRRTIHRMARKGIPAFVDKAGREWSPEAYVMMDMRSTLGNTARAAQNMRCDQYGIQLIEVSSYMGARPKCALYQGRIFSRDGTSGVTTDLNGNKISYTPLSSTSYGEPDGLFGINCGHVQYPYLQGLSIQRYFPYDEEENAERYKQFQRQRAMERDIRATKRECMMLQAAGDEEGLQKASQRLRAQKQKYSAYCKDSGLGTHYDRTQVYGYDRSKSAKTVWAERKAQGKLNSINGFNIPSKALDKASKSGYNFDVEKARSDTLNFLSELPSNTANKKIYNYVQGCVFEEKLDLDCPYQYDRDNNKILFNPNFKGFSDYDPIESIMHESAHSIDCQFYKSFSDIGFSQAIMDTTLSIDFDTLFFKYSKSELTENTYLSDIISALTENEKPFRDFLCGFHKNDYWNKPGNKEAEIFANMFTLESLNDLRSLEFIKIHFPDVYTRYNVITRGES